MEYKTTLETFRVTSESHLKDNWSETDMNWQKIAKIAATILSLTQATRVSIWVPREAIGLGSQQEYYFYNHLGIWIVYRCNIIIWFKKYF